MNVFDEANAAYPEREDASDDIEDTIELSCVCKLEDAPEIYEREVGVIMVEFDVIEAFTVVPAFNVNVPLCVADPVNELVPDTDNEAIVVDPVNDALLMGAFNATAELIEVIVGLVIVPAIVTLPFLYILTHSAIEPPDPSEFINDHPR